MQNVDILFFWIDHVVIVKLFIQNTDEYQNAYKKLKKVTQERITVFLFLRIVDKKKSLVVSANEEKKHKKVIQKLKEEEKVFSFNRALILDVKARSFLQYYQNQHYCFYDHYVVDASFPHLVLDSLKYLWIASMELLSLSFPSNPSLLFVAYSMLAWRERIITIAQWYSHKNILFWSYA